jgi:transposase InsO family protein
MDVHQNARLTPHSRALLVDSVRRGRPTRHVASQFGISERTANKWLKRFEAEGPEGLRDRSSRPRSTPRAKPRELQLAVLALRRQRLTLEAIAGQLELSRSSVARICARAGLNRLTKLEPTPPVRRYERAEPGELLHLDTKKLGRIVRPGHRVTGDRRDSVKRAGWDYVHVAIDDHSRISYAQILPDEQGDSAAVFLRLAVSYYAALGVAIREVLTDNGPCYQSRDFEQACRELSLIHRYTRPYTPRTNGKAERFIQTALREWAYARAYRDSDQRARELPRWLHAYNWHRPHMSLAGQPPVLKLALNRNNLLRLHN